jgi:hypothetical protein
MLIPWQVPRCSGEIISCQSPKTIQQCRDVDQLKTWLEHILEARALEDMGIQPRK